MILRALPGQPPSARFGHAQGQVDFIYKVGPFSFIVALLAGGAGMLALTSAKSATLVGVFISVTTVPAAAFASVALVEGRYAQALGSAAQLAINGREPAEHGAEIIGQLGVAWMRWRCARCSMTA